MRLSVLDQSPVVQGQDPSEAIASSLALARHCDALGYTRYWLSEQHNSDSLVSSAPEVLIAAAAATTHRIRVGSAGLMLPHYSALKVAEQFRMLEALAPGRIDLGVSRAPANDLCSARALSPHRAGQDDQFAQQVQDLRDFIAGVPLPAGHPCHGVTAQPAGPTVPVMWLQGTSEYTARLAARLGLPFGLFHCLRDGEGSLEAMAAYHDNYQPSERYPHPQATLCVWALACDTEDEAQRQLMTRAHWRAGHAQGKAGPLAAPDGAAAFAYSADERDALRRLQETAFVGTGAQVAARLSELADTMKVYEIAVNTWAHDRNVRLRSYSLLAQAFELTVEGPWRR